MSVRVMDHVWKFGKATNGDLLVLLAVADYANDNGEAWPSVSTLAKKARLKERQTQYSLRRLVEAGELQIFANKGPKGCHIYRVILPANKGAENAGVQIMRGALSDKGGAFCDTLGVHSSAPKPSENRHIEPSERERPLTLATAVEMFEPIFPQKAVKASLSRMSKRFKRLLTYSTCLEWLEKEKEAAQPKSRVRTASSDAVFGLTSGGQLSEDEQRQMAMELAMQRSIAGLTTGSAMAEVTS